MSRILFARSPSALHSAGLPCRGRQKEEEATEEQINQTIYTSERIHTACMLQISYVHSR